MSDDFSHSSGEYEDTEQSDNPSDAEENAAAHEPLTGKKRKRVIATELEPEKLKEFEEAEKRKGVIYLACIPPFMKPIKVRHLLEPFGKIGRLYLAPEDPAVHQRRVKAGGNKKPKFVEGWVEFLDKKDAKAVAEALNNQPVEPLKKRSFYAGDRWNMKYLHKFKWHHLTEKIAYEGRIRAQKLRAELSAAKKDAEVYIARAEQAKHIKEKEAKKARTSAGTESAAGGAGDARRDLENVRRHFHQRQPLPDKALDSGAHPK